MMIVSMEYCTRCNKLGHDVSECETILCSICYKLGHSANKCRRKVECKNCLKFGHNTRFCNKNLCIRCNFPINLTNSQFHINNICTNPNYFCRTCGYSRPYTLNCCSNNRDIRFSTYSSRRMEREKKYREKLKNRWLYECRKRFKSDILKNYSCTISKETLNTWDKITKSIIGLKYTNIYSLDKCILFLEKKRTEQINRIFDNISLNKQILNKYTNKIKKLELKIDTLTKTNLEKEKEVINIINYSNELILSLNKQKIDKCMICLSKISLKSVAITKCGHFYCSDCIYKTIDKTNKCAYCREQLTNSDYILCDLINKNFEDCYKTILIKK